MTNNALTKIIATIGPGIAGVEAVRAIIEAGVNVIRFNYKHHDRDWHRERMRWVSEASQLAQKPVAKLIDLQGSEVRLIVPSDEIKAKKGERILASPQTVEEIDAPVAWLSHPEVFAYLADNQLLVADDGDVRMRVERQGDRVWLVTESDCVVKSRKTVSFPGIDISLPVLSERDYEALELSRDEGVGYVALSFVKNVGDITQLRQALSHLGFEAKIVAKIETRQALDNIDGIIKETDGVMIARGDLAIEDKPEAVPYHQKRIIQKSIEQGKFVIIATQMLESMVEKSLPTRAELSDVANSAYDLTDAVMLSAETAIGKYPVQVVKIMRDTIGFNEKKFVSDTRQKYKHVFNDAESLVANAAYDIYLKQLKVISDRVSAFVVYSDTGRSAKMLSMYRPRVPIYAICQNPVVADGMMINFGITPILAPISEGGQITDTQVTYDHIREGVEFLKTMSLIEKDSYVLVVHGDYWNLNQGASTVKLIRV